METSKCIFFSVVSLAIAHCCVSAMPTHGSDDGGGGDGGVDPESTAPQPSRSWSGMLRGPHRRTSVPSRFDTQLTDLNRSPTYYNYQTLPEAAEVASGSSVWNSRSRKRRSRLDFGLPILPSGGDREFPSLDILAPPRFPHDDRPAKPEWTPASDFAQMDCIHGGPACTPKPPKKYLDFYS